MIKNKKNKKIWLQSSNPAGLGSVMMLCILHMCCAHASTTHLGKGLNFPQVVFLRGKLLQCVKKRKIKTAVIFSKQFPRF